MDIQDGTVRMEQLRQNCRDRQDRQDRIARTNRTARTIQPEQDKHDSTAGDKKAGTGQPGQNSQEKT
jgi:hypothetical protein